ncbi:MAG: polymer-forming cytoskeletal protein [Betaproteobacteria bacterium]|nr:polymer-forming cytoskeletal protein [Betaproteobacteria bacterium]
MFNKPANPFSRPQEPAARDLLASQPRSTTSTIQPGNPASSTSSTARPASTTQNAGTPVAPAQNSDTLGETGSRLIVGPDVKLKSAEILDCDTLVVEGRVEATMDSRVIRIADRGVYSGKVSIDIAEIHGQFEGELTARSQLIIHATGKVSGKIRYGKILIEEGGQISGEIKSLAEEESPVIRPRTEILANLKAAVG